MVTATRKLRPSGPEHVITDEIVAGIERLLADGKTQAQIAAELSEHVGRVVDESTISNMKRRSYPTSRHARDIAVLYGWPLPPMAGLEEDLSEAQAKLDELHHIAPGAFRLVSAIIESHLESERNLRGRGPK